jgi:hypothetical protein
MPPILPVTNLTAWLSGTSNTWKQTHPYKSNCNPPLLLLNITLLLTPHNNYFKLISRAPLLPTSLAVNLAIIKNRTTHRFSELCPRIFKIFPQTVAPKKAIELRPRPLEAILPTCEYGRRLGSAGHISLRPTIGMQEQKANLTACAPNGHSDVPLSFRFIDLDDRPLKESRLSRLSTDNLCPRRIWIHIKSF